MAWRQQVCSHQSIKHHQTRPESVIFSLSFRNIQQHQEPSASISNIHQPNLWHTLTFDTPWQPWHTFSCFPQVYTWGQGEDHPASRPRVFSASLRQVCRILPVQDATNNEKNTPCTNIRTNMHKYAQTWTNHVIIFVVILLQSPLSTASANCGGSCKCKASVPKCRRKERMRWETDQLRIPFVLFISLHVLSFCSHSCFDWDETFCFTR